MGVWASTRSGVHMETVVLSLGGSVLIPDDDDLDFLRGIASLLRRLSADCSMVVVCGGGRIARYYIENGRELGGSEEELDSLGIKVTRINADLLRLALGDRSQENLPTTEEEAVRLLERNRIVVMGGTVPGQTTDAVAASVAELSGADRIVNATSVDAVYSDDPREVGDARRFERLTFDQFLEVLGSREYGAGQTAVFERKGAETARRAGIPVYIVSGRDLEEMERAVKGQQVKGTVIS